MGCPTPLAAALGLSVVLGFSTPIQPRAQENPPAPTKKPSSTGDSPPPPAIQKSIAGILGFKSVSSLTYEDAPATTHQLIATYIFPDCARWFLGVGDEKSPERQMRYRFHERAFSVAPRSSTSLELQAEERANTLQQMELRRALMLWPDGFDWKVAGEGALADLGSLGSLRARFEKPVTVADLKDRASGQRPIQVTSLNGKAEEIESFRALTWQEIHNRRWPATAELWHAGKRIWREQFESIETSVRYVDSYFLPADRRELQPSAHPMRGRVQPLDVPETVSLRVELKSGETWEGAMTECSKLRNLWELRLKKEGLELDPKNTIELTSGMQPAACVLRLSTVPTAPPSEFARQPARAAVATMVDGWSDVSEAQLSALARALPKESKTLAAYVRVDPEQAKTGPILLVLPTAEAR
jgi:hypothetical protein